MPIPRKKESPQVLSAKEKIYNQVLEWIVDGTLDVVYRQEHAASQKNEPYEKRASS